MQKGTLFADFFTGSQKTAPFVATPSVTASPCHLPQGGRYRFALPPLGSTSECVFRIRLFPSKTDPHGRGIGSLCRRLVRRRNEYSASVCFLAKQTSLFEGGVSEADGRSSPVFPPILKIIREARLFLSEQPIFQRGSCFAAAGIVYCSIMNTHQMKQF